MSDDEQRRRDSGSDSSLSGIPIALRRDKSIPSSDDELSSSAEERKREMMATSLDFSYLELDLGLIESNITSHLKSNRPEMITTLNLSGNNLESLPTSIDTMINLQVLDLSQNSLSSISESINHLTNLSTLIASNNRLTIDSFPKDFGLSLCNSLRVLSLGGNLLSAIPGQVLELTLLKSLYMGGNQLTEIPRDIRKLENLRILYLGGNQLTCIPNEIGALQNLQGLSLCENKLRTLPSSVANLRNLRSLALHKNLLTALPPEIVKLRGLHELSLRNNPLVSRFVKEFEFDCPSLLELAGRVVKVNKIPYSRDDLPQSVREYLEAGRRCVNPKCKGVFFDARVEHIKFVDFCGIYRLPLLQYLCSPKCTSTPAHLQSSSDSDETEDVPINKLKRVLLG